MDIGTDKNRFITALKRGVPDRVPLCEFFIDTGIKEKFIGEKVGDVITGEDYLVKNDIRFWKEAGYDYIHIAPIYGNLFPTTWRISKESDSLYDEKKRVWAEEGYGPIRSRRDFEEYPWPDLSRVNFEILEQAEDCLPAEMGLTTGTWGIFELVRFLTGFEGFCYMVTEDIDLALALFERTGGFIFEVFRKSLSYKNVVAAWFADDLASDAGFFISPEIYREYLFPWMRKICREAISRDIPVIYHCDGNIEKIMEELIDIGFSAIQPFEPKAMDIVKIKKKYGNKIAVIGNIDLGGVLVRGSPQDVEEEVKKKIKLLGPGGGYLLGSSNSITNYVPLANYKAMMKACLKYGRYPISI